MRAPGRITASQSLAALVEPADLFHTPDGRGYATLQIDGHHETWPVRSKRFKAWLGRAYYATVRKPAPTQAMTETIALAEARALEGPEQPVHVRVAKSGEMICIDLADDRWRVVEVDAKGWRVLEHSPVKFHRAAGMHPLPMPTPGAPLETLRAFVNVADENTWRLLVHWLVMGFSSPW